ncbi:hypothetical protein SS1G_02912 [Sclerotinia sclerotiorum 1980 UF-70]|uniref:gamma-glutamylcyclotransferase n=1 Tax=Sclerotinia sclerotiorum (strain ATCC 18683 / 1980 / Ss-1) TaxID=665079 RepID=A7EC74_SCLS1|nr:hypothetical protein SS1G_02912 [Sclerotinia sclerotiorum 1980 UF-70]EDO00053.1 hypothetical protein SS1G_02912 [Sclerotinia sclerotiorum 1980 UF-70]
MQCDEEPRAPSQRFWDLYTPKPPAVLSQPVKVPKTSTSRLELSSAPLLPPTSASREEPKTVLYLAYGSNLSAETFKGKRGIKPLSAVNVHVPAIDLTFDLCGIPYAEPCFANCQYRKIQPGSPRSKDYHKTRWHKGLVGVVYEVTLDDYRTIIATEGGGTSYKDELVQCYVLPDGSKTVDPNPSGTPFQAHTLLCPFDSKDPNRICRPDPNYAQPSARYLKLITDGAKEHNLPEEYINYLYAWVAYDSVLKDMFGDGERTIGGKALTDIEEIDLEKRWDEKKMARSGEIKETLEALRTVSEKRDMRDVSAVLLF